MLTYLFMVRTNSVMQCRVGWCGDGEIPPASLPPPTLSWQPAASPARGRWRLPQSSVLGDGSLEELRHNTNNFLAPGGTTQQQYNGNTLRTSRTQVIYAISTRYLRGAAAAGQQDEDRAAANICPGITTSAWNEGYPNVSEDFTITEKVPTRAFSVITNLRIAFVWSTSD